MVHEIGDDAVRWIRLHEILNLFVEEHCAFVELSRGRKVGGVGHGFNAIGEADLLGGEINGVNAEEEGIGGGE
jgi:hypothetical protein